MAEENNQMSGETVNNCDSAANVQMDMFSDTWGFSLEDLYQIAVTFYKGMYIILNHERKI